MKKGLGTPSFMSPQVLKTNYTNKCDIWSCGVIAYYLLSGKCPFEAFTLRGLQNKIIAGSVSFEDPVWNTVPESAKDFIKALLMYEEDQRPSAAEALDLDWIKENSTITPDEIMILSCLDNLKLCKFHQYHELRMHHYIFIANNILQASEKEGPDKVFRLLDTSNNGTLSREEIRHGYAAYN